jgi:UDP-glucose 4-epimerase
MFALVTGATGLIGRHLVAVLRSNGVRLRALARPSSNTQALETQGIEIIRGDYRDRETLATAVAGVDVVFHVAGYVTVMAPFTVGKANGRAWEPYRSVNVDFTAALLEASLAANVGRFLHVSSNSIYSPHVLIPTTEDAPLGPISLYGRSKLLAEEAVSRYQERGLATTIIRPSIVYGPGDRAFTPLALRLARLPFLPLVNGGRNLLDLAYAADVAELLWTAAQHPIAIGRVYNAGPGKPTSLYELIAAYRQLTGSGPRILPISTSIINSLSWLAPQAMTLLTLNIHLDMRRAAEELNFHPHYKLKEGLAATLAATDRSR